jgi:hypothetical protein
MSDAQLAAAIALLAKSGRAFETQISGSSMGDALRDGSVVRVEPVDAASLQPGDVFAFRDDTGRIVAHRLVRIGRRGAARDYAIALGDGNRFPDPPVALTAILGKVASWRDGEAWRGVPPAARRPLPDRWMSAAAVRAVVIASEVSVAFARWMCGFVIIRKR